jgi:Poly A polymerase head domain
MRLPPTAQVCRPRPEEELALRNLLSQSVPPGVTHMQLVQEVWSRGYEVFVTGAAVRDVICESAPVDVDLVTTMPIDRLHQLAFAMYGRPPGLCDLDRFAGSLRLGGTRGTPDPFLEVRAFQYNMPGTADALFGANFEREAGHRDFSCNCIYYDPVNNVFIDPTGQGLEDAATTRVRVVFDRRLVSGDQLGRMSLHFLKMTALGFSAAIGQDAEIQVLLRALAGLTSLEITSQLRVQVLEQLNPDLRVETYERLHQLFIDIGEESVWLKSIDPYRAELLS